MSEYCLMIDKRKKYLIGEGEVTKEILEELDRNGRKIVEKLEEILEKDGEPVSREKLYGNCEDIKFEDIEYTFIGNYMESVRITDPDIRFGILQIGVGSSKKEVMLAYGLKETLSNEEENEYAVQNGIYSTSFYFDENDRVYKIACGTGV